ncbi:MAG TPA: hypothetical protein P5531_01955 [Bacteroidales bacterium]|nr:hypothetical protein [Bacteroidales bacterium]HSA43057.1 hypothetical protein [Bacteroidales bacterium]
MIRIHELPREAFQTHPRVLPFQQKLQYLQALLSAGFHTVETGSVVSPRLLPQMADSLKLVESIDLSGTNTRLMMLLVNSKGADLVAPYETITCLSYPFSISRVFAEKNQKSSPEDLIRTADYIMNICTRTGREFIPYLSMAFGNPYGDPWTIEILMEWVMHFRDKGISYLPLSNVSIAISPVLCAEVFRSLYREFPDMEFGLHLHTRRGNALDCLKAAWDEGCRNFDTVMAGLGGCPMTGHELLSNLDTAEMLDFLDENNINAPVSREAYLSLSALSRELFGNGS